MPRVIYSLAFDVLHRGQQMLLIAPLLPDGQSPHCRACAPKCRVIDLRPGDQVEHGQSRYRIKKVSAYRQAFYGAAGPRPDEGYAVRGS
jgi:hypothetical protein